MLVLKIEQLDKKKSKVMLENGESYILYKSEIYQLNIEEGNEYTDEMEKGVQQVLVKRAKKRCLYLLQKMDRTRAQLIDKLKEGGYPLYAIEEAIAYIESFHYIDDIRYAQNYISSGIKTKSRKQLSFELERRGVDSQIIKQELENIEVSEEDILKEQIKKKYGQLDLTIEKNKLKVFRYFCNKGFSYEKVRVAYEIYMDEFTQF